MIEFSDVVIQMAIGFRTQVDKVQKTTEQLHDEFFREVSEYNKEIFAKMGKGKAQQ